MLVEMIILVTPSGGRPNTACCSSLDRLECSGYTAHLPEDSGATSGLVCQPVLEGTEVARRPHDLLVPLLLKIRLHMSCSYSIFISARPGRNTRTAPGW